MRDAEAVLRGVAIVGADVFREAAAWAAADVG
jgi:hypothetical protein